MSIDNALASVPVKNLQAALHGTSKSWSGPQIRDPCWKWPNGNFHAAVGCRSINSQSGLAVDHLRSRLPTLTKSSRAPGSSA